MRVAVIGGTGVVGRHVVDELAARGDAVRIVSRTPPPDARHVGGDVEHRRADLATGDGLASALDGVDAVVDVANARRAARAVLVDGTRRLLVAEAAHGVRHHVLISIVGCDRVPISYYRVKVEQERAVQDGGVPWSVLRATQFHQLVAGMFAAAGRARLRPTGAARVQPVDPRLVAARIADAVHAGPGGMLPEIGGPQIATVSELAAAWRAHGAAGRAAVPVRVPMVGRVGAALRAGALCNPGAAAGGPTFAQWLERERHQP